MTITARHRRVIAAAAAALSLSAAAVALGAPATISGVAGTGSSGFSGDGGPATLAQLDQPADLARLPDGDVLVADTANNRIRRIDSDGTITTFAGSSTGDGPGCGASATGIQLTAPEGVAVTPSGNVVIANTGGSNVVTVDVSKGVISEVINGTFVGGAPADVAAPDDGSYLVADRPGRRIVRVVPGACASAPAQFSTVAGSGAVGASGDGGPATSAAVGQPDSISAASATSFLFADRENNRIRAVAGGVISTVAGSGVAATTGDGGAATAAGINTPTGVTRAADGGFLVAEQGGGRVRRVSPAGVISTAAVLGGPADTLGADGGFLAADRTGAAIRRVMNATPDPATPAQRLPVSAPVVRRTAVVEVVRGIVRVRPRGKKGFVRLGSSALITVGSEIDTERGVARVTVASDAKGTLAPATVRGGRFVISQGRGARPISQFALSAPLPGCPRTRKKARRASVAARKRKTRRLWVQTKKKRFRTKGRYATGTVRGTRWLTTDGCRLTRIAVTSGVVTVRDLSRKRTRAVKKGRSYTARAR